MYRQYEDPYRLEQWLAKVEAEYEEAVAEGDDEDRIYDLYCEMESLKDRINFAWQDDEAAEMGWD